MQYRVVFFPFPRNGQRIRRFQVDTDFFCNAPCLRHGCSLVGIQFTQHHHKFVTTNPGNGVRGTHTVGQSFRYLNQQQVAYLVPMRVVENFEIVEVQKHQCAVEAISFTQGDRLGQSIIEHSPIRKPRQFVMKSHFTYPLFRLCSSGNLQGQLVTLNFQLFSQLLPLHKIAYPVAGDGDVDRFGDVVNSPQRQSRCFRVCISQSRHKNDRNVFERR